MVSSDFECRFNRPGAIVEKTPRFSGEDAELKASDPSAWEHLQALIIEAREEGLSIEENADLPGGRGGSYRAPIGDRAFKKARRNGHVPWVGEFRLEPANSMNGEGRLWRAYFHDLTTADGGAETDSVLMSSLRAKRVGGAVRPFIHGVALSEQDRHILDAIDEARRWVRDNPYFRLRVLQDQRA